MVHTYGTNMQQAVSLAIIYIIFFFKPDHHGNSAKGLSGGGLTSAS